MEAFRLLSRSTNLKQGTTSVERRVSHIPSEGDAQRTNNDTVNENTAKREELGSGGGGRRKRKREADSEPSYNTHSGQTSIPDGADEGGTRASKQLSTEECRSIHKSHKVRIVCLRGKVSHEHSNSRSQIPTTRKREKEAARLNTQPLTSFDLLTTRYNGSRTLLRNIREQGYKAPTQVQLATIPLLLDAAQAGLDLPQAQTDVDLLTVAPTGSGKTLAFLAPLIQRIVRDRHINKIQGRKHQSFSALVIAPTKELVGQIVNEGRKLCLNTGVSIVSVRKGMHVAVVEQRGRKSEEEGEDGKRSSSVAKADIFVTTPGALQNIVDDDGIELSSVRHLVLDEADVLLDPLFREQTLSLWNRCTNELLRTSLWSATIGSDIEALTLHILNERSTRPDTSNSSPLLRCVIGLKDTALPTIDHRLVYTATEPGKLLGLRQLLHPSSTFDGDRPTLQLRPPFLVFTQTIERAIALHAELLYDIPTEAGGSSRLAVLHSDLSDLKRSDIMARFRKGQVWILITTDLLSRGMDFCGVNGVVNYDIPTSTAAYVHRVGRTGRAGREGGIGITFYTREDIKYVKAIANAIAVSEKARGTASSNDTRSRTTKGQVQPWLLNALPDVRKRDRQALKKHGVDIRCRMRYDEEGKIVDDEGVAKAKRRARISTKSGYQRRLENKRRGAAQTKRGNTVGQPEDSDDDWSGFDS